jgi:hypothetical protein
MNEFRSILEMLLFELTTTGVLNYDQWLELHQQLLLPIPQPDPVPGRELAPSEDPPTPEERDPYERMAEIFRKSEAREKELQRTPPKPNERIQRAAHAAAKIQQRLRELADLGGHLDVELEPDEPWEFLEE